MKPSYEKFGRAFALKDTASFAQPDVLSGAMKVMALALGIDTVAGFEYLVTYGYEQSMQDSIAGDAKRVTEKLIADAEAAGQPKPTDDEISAHVQSVLLQNLSERHENIVAGTVEARGTRNPFETACRDFAESKLVEGYRKNNWKLPDRKTDAGRKEYKELVQGVLDRNRDAIEKEIKAQQARAAKIEIKL